MDGGEIEHRAGRREAQSFDRFDVIGELRIVRQMHHDDRIRPFLDGHDAKAYSTGDGFAKSLGIDRGIGFPNLGAVLAPRVPLAEKTRGASTAAK